MTVTCDTPSTASNRLRMVNSARVRASIAFFSRSSSVFASPVWRTPSSMISPMSDEIGASIGLTPAGSRSRASCSFSETICRSR